MSHDIYVYDIFILLYEYSCISIKGVFYCLLCKLYKVWFLYENQWNSISNTRDWEKKDAFGKINIK